MAKAVGVGGVFLKAKDPKGLQSWYHEHLGVPLEGGYSCFDGPEAAGMTVFSFFPEDTKYFGEGEQRAMINFRVDSLDEVLQRLTEAGVRVDPKGQDESFGRFGWFWDPEGNRRAAGASCCLRVIEPAPRQVAGSPTSRRAQGGSVRAHNRQPSGRSRCAVRHGLHGRRLPREVAIARRPLPRRWPCIRPLGGRSGLRRLREACGLCRGCGPTQERRGEDGFAAHCSRRRPPAHHDRAANARLPESRKLQRDGAASTHCRFECSAIERGEYPWKSFSSCATCPDKADECASLKVVEWITSGSASSPTGKNRGSKVVRGRIDPSDQMRKRHWHLCQDM